MGFTIDMVSGNISNITNGIHSAKVEAISPRNPSIEGEQGAELPQEQLLPVADTLIKPDYIIPTSLINGDVDSFIKDATQ